MTFLLILIWNIILLFEAIGPFIRIGGYFSKRGELSIIVQNQISLLSRVFAFSFAILFGIHADNGISLSSISSPVTYLSLFTLFPALVYLLHKRIYLINLFANFLQIYSESHDRSLFKSLFYFVKSNQPSISFERNFYYSTPSRQSLFLCFLSFFLLYLSWPICIFLVSHFPGNRSFLASLPTIFVSFNSIYVSTYLDPKLVRSQSPGLYLIYYKVRIFAALFYPVMSLIVISAL